MAKYNQLLLKVVSILLFSIWKVSLLEPSFKNKKNKKTNGKKKNGIKNAKRRKT